MDFFDLSSLPALRSYNFDTKFAQCLSKNSMSFMKDVIASTDFFLSLIADKFF